MELPIDQNLRALRTFYPQLKLKDAAHLLNLTSVKGMPPWIKGAADVFEANIEEKKIYFVVPKIELELEHLIRLFRVLAEKLKVEPLISADNLPPKHRPLLVRFNVPFIYKDQSIFAPELGLKFADIRALTKAFKKTAVTVSQDLSPFATKLIAGILTNNIPGSFSLKALHEMLDKKGWCGSLSKLSMTVTELANQNMIIPQGLGPTKSFVRAVGLWEKFQNVSVAPLYRKLLTEYIPKDMENYVYSGERALSNFSSLAKPEKTEIAMTMAAYKQVYSNSANLRPAGDFGFNVVVQLWKTDPRLFMFDHCLNPLELFLTLKSHPDERIQLSIDEMLNRYKLKR